MPKDFRARLITRVLLLALCLILGQGLLWARGQMEADLAVIDQLIAEGDYENALLLLNEFGKKYGTEGLSELNKRTRIINEEKRKTTDLIIQYLDTIKNDPRNFQKQSALLAQIQQRLAKTKDEGAKKKFSELLVIATTATNNAKLDDIFIAAKKFLDAKDYQGAIAVYEKGFSIYYADFYGSGIIPIEGVTNTAATAIAMNLDSGGETDPFIKRFQEYYKSILTIDAKEIAAAGDYKAGLGALNAAFAKSDLQSIQTALDAIQPSILKLLERRATFLSLAAQVDSEIQGNKDKKRADGSLLLLDGCFPNFMWKILMGRPNAKAPEGIAIAWQLQWQEIANGLRAAPGNSTDAAFNSAYALFVSGDNSGAKEAFGKSGKLARLGLKSMALQSASYGTDSPTAPGNSLNLATAASVSAYNRLSYIAKLSDEYILLADIRISQNPKVKNTQDYANALESDKPDTQAALARVSQLRAELNAETDRLKALGAEVKDSGAPWRPVIDSGFAPGDIDTLQKEILANIAEDLAKNRQTEIRAVTQLADYRLGGIENASEGKLSLYDKAIVQLNGDQNIKNENGIVEKHPTLALANINNLLAFIPGTISELRAFISLYGQTEVSYVKDDVEVISIVARAKELLAKLESTSALAAALRAKAEKQAAEASAKRSEGDGLYAEALNALAKKNFELATAKADAATVAWLASLALEYLPENFSDMSKKHDDILAKIEKGRRDTVADSVATKIEKAKNLYDQGLYADALVQIKSAKEEWETIPDLGDNEQLNQWYTTINNAVRLDIGRTVTPDDPSYPVISQSLAKAADLYQRGADALAKGKKVEALDLFAQAEAELKKVLTIYPQNQDANLLSLRIQFAKDPDNAKRLFELKVAEGNNLYNQKNYVEAYNLARSLVQIDPKSKTAQDLLYKCEIATGKRVAPPSAEDVAKSNQLYQQGLRLYNIIPRTLENLQKARDLVNQALKTNINNKSASQLSTLIARATIALTQPQDTGKPTNLSLADAQLFEQATELVAQQQYSQALEILTDLNNRYNNANVQKRLKFVKGQI